MIVVLCPDTGRNYLSKLYSEEWMIEKGFMKPRGRSYTIKELLERRGNVPVIAVRPDAKAEEAINLLRRHGISQLPVIEEGGRVIGLVDESDVLAALLTDSGGASRAFARPVKDVMVTRLETISADAPIAELVPLFRKDYIAIVMDGDQFLGVATRLDLINHFRITP